jgi:hypothetical protein
MRSIAPFVALLLSATPAAAMWEGVRWNMSPAAVLAATRGQTQRAEAWGGRRVKPTRRPEQSLRDLVEGERLLGGVRVQATFWFNADGRLWSVTEQAVEADFAPGDLCAQLEEALLARYGDSDLVTEKGDLRHLIWRDEPGRTRIHLRDGGGDCVVEYRELRGPLDR